MGQTNKPDIGPPKPPIGWYDEDDNREPGEIDGPYWKKKPKPKRVKSKKDDKK